MSTSLPLYWLIGALLVLSSVVPVPAVAQFLAENESARLSDEVSVFVGSGLESSPRLTLGSSWRVSDRAPRMRRPLSVSLAVHSPMWLIGSGDHLGVSAGTRWSAFKGPWKLDLSGWSGIQAWHNDIARGTTWWLSSSVLPGWHRGVGYIGVRAGMRSAVLSRIRHEDVWSRWVDSRDGWYRGTASNLDLTIRGGAEIARRVLLEMEVGARLPLDLKLVSPYELPWIAGLKVVVALPVPRAQSTSARSIR